MRRDCLRLADREFSDMSKQPKVFISHSFDKKANFLNVADPLAAAGIPYWNPDTDVRPGSSLRDQLRQAISECCVCIFVATRTALASDWCASELGAFWGAGKPIIVYMADPSLTEDNLPEIVQGDVYEEVISKVVAAAGEVVKNSAPPSGKVNDPESAAVGNLTVGQLKELIAGVLSLAAATSKSEGGTPTFEEIGRAARGAADSVVGGIRATERRQGSAESWRKHVLWVDDKPTNNVYERQAFEAMGLKFTLALSTQQALDILSKERFAAVISDLGRPEGAEAGFDLLKTMRDRGDKTPFFVYAGQNAVKKRHVALALGAQGSTYEPQELFDMVTGALS